MADQDIKLTPLLGYYYLKMLNEEHLKKKNLFKHMAEQVGT